jgi:hypothetical protein
MQPTITEIRRRSVSFIGDTPSSDPSTTVPANGAEI